jgi:hypothetical protein
MSGAGGDSMHGRAVTGTKTAAKLAAFGWSPCCFPLQWASGWVTGSPTRLFNFSLLRKWPRKGDLIKKIWAVFFFEFKDSFIRITITRKSVRKKTLVIVNSHTSSPIWSSLSLAHKWAARLNTPHKRNSKTRKNRGRCLCMLRVFLQPNTKDTCNGW